MSIIVYAPDLFKRKRIWPGMTKERDAYLREHFGIDPAVLAMALGLTEEFIVAYQGYLGLKTKTDLRNCRHCSKAFAPRPQNVSRFCSQSCARRGRKPKE